MRGIWWKSSKRWRLQIWWTSASRIYFKTWVRLMFTPSNDDHQSYPGHMEGAPHFQTIIQLSNDYPIKMNINYWFSKILCGYPMIIKYRLVVSNMFYFPFHIWDNPSHWRTHIFQDGYCTTNQFTISLPIYKWDHHGFITIYGIIKMVKTTNQNSSKWFFQNPLAPPKKVTIESMYCRYGMQADGRSQSLGCTVLGTNTWPGPQTVSESWIFQKSNRNRSIAHICSLIWIKKTRSSSLLEHTSFFLLRFVNLVKLIHNSPQKKANPICEDKIPLILVFFKALASGCVDNISHEFISKQTMIIVYSHYNHKYIFPKQWTIFSIHYYNHYNYIWEPSVKAGHKFMNWCVYFALRDC